MSGHSKWSQIKHKKGLTDQKKGQLFGKLGKIISIAARTGADPAFNPKLQAAIDRARLANMPSGNIERAIKRASDKDSIQLSEMRIETIGPGSVAIIINTVTDNKNRTLNEIKTILSKNDAKMAAENSLDWLFDKKGVIDVELPPGTKNIEDLELRLIECGADDIRRGQNIEIIVAVENIGQVKNKLQSVGLVIVSSEISLIPKNPLKIDDSTINQKIEKFFQELDDHDDVDSFFSSLG